MPSREEMLNEIRKDLEEIMKPCIGIPIKEFKESTKEDFAKALERYYKSVIDDEDYDVEVTPSEEKDMFNVSFKIPVHEYVIDLNKGGNESDDAGS